MGDLPTSLEREAIYLVADGQYAGRSFDDPGDTSIVILKATTDEHGDAPGWSSDTGDGQAVFGPLSFEAGHYELDGAGALIVEGAFQGTVIQVGGDHT